MAIKIQVRRDTAASWTAANPVLAQGEPGMEIDTGFIKWGDGTTAWNSLSYETVQGHASKHASGGTDAVTLSQTQITGLVQRLSDIESLSAIGL